MSITASFPPNQTLPTPHQAARHIATEASTLLTSLRGGPPHVARGELAGGLHALRSLVRGMAMEGFPTHDHHAVNQTFDDHRSGSNTAVVPLSSPRKENPESQGAAPVASLPPPPLSDEAQPDEQDVQNASIPECPTTPTTQSPQTLPMHPNTPTPHAVPSPTKQDRATDSLLLEEWPRNNYVPKLEEDTPSQEGIHETITPNNDPGPYAAPFLAVIIDPRFSGPHTLVALRALHRLLSRGSIVQLCTEPTTSVDDNGLTANNYPFYTHLQPIALGVLACRFEQTDAGADEAVEMAIADLLGLVVEFDGAGVRSVEKSMLEKVREKKRSVKQGQPMHVLPQSGNKKIRIPRLPASVIMEAFHAVFITRQTFVKGGIHVGHYSPALSNHFEQVLMKMIHCVFGGEDSANARMIRELSSRHGGAARAILEFLIDQILSVSLLRGGEGGNSNWMEGNAMQQQDGRVLCLRLIQCCIKTGWGVSGAVLEEDAALLRIVEDDLCLALLTTGQATWAEDGLQGAITTSPGVLSEVCSTFSLLWSLGHLRKRLHSQFVAIFSGFYQRALSLLRKRPLPEDGLAFQSYVAFDLEAEVILESLVDILCLHGGSSLSTLEELFGTYDCSMIELDVASGLLVELSLCCGGCVDEEGEAVRYSAPMSKTASSGSRTPSSKEGSAQQMSLRYRPVPDHLKELCSQALLGCIKQLCRASDQTDAGENETDAPGRSLRKTKEQKRVLHHAAKLFNEKPSKGIQYLLDNDMLPNPVTPESVSSFLRNGLVVGLDKAAVGQYLGEKGKAPSPEKSPAVWDLESFHKDVLAAFCSSFSFEKQSLVDGLRMFLATFRLPGEAQMIDRILQGFSESCGCSCEESVNGTLKLFSKDEKRSSDAAYLLSFSIIMLNTDLHNDNIRADRKMKVNDFVKNNTNYGKEISDSDLPRDYLEKLYNNIKTNQIRTLGEGADGSMTIERWKDVMSGAKSQSTESDLRGIKDLKELLLETSWQPIFSAISGLWGMNRIDRDDEGFELIRTGRLQNARLGIELAYELLTGASGRPDIFQDLFSHVCLMSGLLGEYNAGPDERSLQFMNSIERQSALIVAMKVCLEHGDVVGLDGWKCVWGMIFELRDLQLLSARTIPTLMAESDADLLSPDARLDFSNRITRGEGYENESPRQGGGLFGLFRAASSTDDLRNQMQDLASSVHCKDVQLLWDDVALSDDESDYDSERNESSSFSPRNMSPIGVAFQHRFATENASGEHDMPVTGLERLDAEGADGESLRARVRDRLAQLIDFYGLVSESRFLDFNLGLSDSINALVEIIHDASKQASAVNGMTEVDDSFFGLPLSPASEALAEIILCEITLKNRDRFATIWENILTAHYNHRLSKGSDDQLDTLKLTPGIEKCVTSVLRMCNFAISRNVIASDVLGTLNILHPPFGSLFWSPLELNLDKHLSEGIWRICQNVDGLSQVNSRGWEGILGLLEWCASRGGLPSSVHQPGILADDDPSLQAFRSLHLLLHANELKDSVPPSVVTALRCLVEAGERANSTRLSIAGLDLLQVLHLRLESSISGRNRSLSEVESKTLARHWLPILEAIAEPAEKSRNTGVRQQAISLLTDALLDRHGSNVPKSTICCTVNGLCIPLAEKRITDLLRTRGDDNDYENTMVELELCISLLFKPLLHHLKALLSIETEFIGIWISLLGIMTQLLGNEPCSNYSRNPRAVVSKESLLQRTKELGSEHLRNAIMVMFALGVLTEDADNELSSVTWAAIGSIGYCKPLVHEWKQSAMVDTSITVETNAEV